MCRTAQAVCWKAIRILCSASLLAALAALPAAGAPQPPLYRVTLPAADREARSELARRGVAIDEIGPGTVTTLMSAAALASLETEGLFPLAVEPLDFPPGDAAYHNYDEMRTAIAQAVAAYPDVTRAYTVGLSLEGRPIVAVKISDEPDVDDPAEPDVLFFALTHAREHLTVEMALEIIRMFTGGYGADPALTNLVNTRELWVLPNVNPDGGEYDVETGRYRYWRKNRRPNADSSYGVDLNRNYGYNWGCCGGSSAWPSSDLFRGTGPFSEPETQVVRDFVLAHPDITAAITFHTYAELILYPYGYTYDNLPADMDEQDHRVFVALAGRMAQTNGYTPQQASDLYITSGDAVDWLYGARRIFAFTFEMYPRYDPPGFYPPAAVISAETQRNRAAVTYLAAMADNPRKVIGIGGDTVAPTAVVTVSAESVVPGAPITATAMVSDDVGVTLVAWQMDDVTIAMQTAPPFELIWPAATPGVHTFRATAYDAGGNVGLAEPITVTALYTAEASLLLPDPPIVDLHEPLRLIFTYPISGSSLALSFEPPLDFTVISADTDSAQIVHAPFQPATAYTLSLTTGFGPDVRLAPAAWSFRSVPWRRYLPLIISGLPGSGAQSVRAAR